MSDKLHEGLKKAGLHGATRHLFFCIGPDCCGSREGERLWEHVKKRLKESGLRVMRTKAACFRICNNGPLLVIYPDGTWYGQVTPARFERILLQHLLGGEPVREWLLAENSFGCSAIPAPAAGNSSKAQID